MKLDLGTFKREVGNWEKVATIHEFHVSEIMEVIDRAIVAEAKVAEQKRRLELVEGFAGNFFDKSHEAIKKIVLLKKALELLANAIASSLGFEVDCERCPHWNINGGDITCKKDGDEKFCAEFIVNDFIEKARAEE